MKVAAGRFGYAATTNTINSPTSAVNSRSASARHGVLVLSQGARGLVHI